MYAFFMSLQHPTAVKHKLRQEVQILANKKGLQIARY